MPTDRSQLHLALKQLNVPTEAFYELRHGPRCAILSRLPSVARSAEFNATVLNHPDVRYFSYSAAATIPFYSPYYPSYRVIQRVEGENDGLVSVSSAMWGTHLPLRDRGFPRV